MTTGCCEHRNTCTPSTSSTFTYTEGCWGCPCPHRTQRHVHPLRVMLEGTGALLPYQCVPTRTSLSPAFLPDPPFPTLSPIPNFLTLRLSPFCSSWFFTQERLLLKCSILAAPPGISSLWIQKQLREKARPFVILTQGRDPT